MGGAFRGFTLPPPPYKNGWYKIFAKKLHLQRLIISNYYKNYFCTFWTVKEKKRYGLKKFHPPISGYASEINHARTKYYYLSPKRVVHLLRYAKKRDFRPSSPCFKISIGKNFLCLGCYKISNPPPPKMRT